MTTEYVQPGETIDFTLAGTVASGAIVVLKHIIGIALKPGVSGDVSAVGVEGVFENVAKVTAAVFVVGEKLIWDTSASKFDDSSATPATGDITGAVVAVIAGANGETTCTVKLTPGNATLT